MKRWRDRFPGRTFVNVGGVDLHYEREGKGPAVLLVHGLGDSHATWRACVTPLAKKGFDVIAIDLKGSGYSEKPADSDYSTRALIDEMAQVLDKLKIKKAVIAGVSYGGHLALRFAVVHRERTSALIVCNALAYAEPINVPFDLTVARMPGFRHIAHWFLSHRGLLKTYRQWNFTGAYDGIAERVAEHWRFLSMPGGRRAYLALVHGIDERLVRAAEREHGSITAATLLLWGGVDPWFPVVQAQRLKKAIRGAKLLVVPNGSHHFMEESPTAFVSRAAPFLARALKPKKARRTKTTTKKTAVAAKRVRRAG